jgi:hypothetical protein
MTTNDSHGLEKNAPIAEAAEQNQSVHYENWEICVIDSAMELSQKTPTKKTQ